MKWRKVRLGEILTESKIPSEKPDPDKRIKVRLNVMGVEKRGLENEIDGATKQFIRKAGQFIYGRQNFHKGAFGIIPTSLDKFETSADIPCFDLSSDCLPEWVYYFFKIGDRYKELEKIARGVGSKRIHPEQIYNIEIPLPSITEQSFLIESFRRQERQQSYLSNELNTQLELIKKLQLQILKEAIQGKLLPQDPNDEPSSELLKRIKAEKEQLISQNTLKKEKLLPPIRSDEIPFEIPKSWVWCKMGEISFITSGSTPSQDAFVETGIPYLKMYNLRNQKIDFYYKPQYIKEDVHNGQLKRCRAYPGDILMNIVGPPLGKIAIIPDDIDQCNFNQAAVLIRPFVKEMNSYIFWYLNEMTEINSIDTKGVAGQNNISVTQAHNMKIPLPPLSEQHRIIDRIDQLMAISSDLKHNILQSQRYTQQLMQVALKEALSEES